MRAHTQHFHSAIQCLALKYAHSSLSAWPLGKGLCHREHQDTLTLSSREQGTEVQQLGGHSLHVSCCLGSAPPPLAPGMRESLTLTATGAHFLCPSPSSHSQGQSPQTQLIVAAHPMGALPHCLSPRTQLPQGGVHPGRRCGRWQRPCPGGQECLPHPITQLSSATCCPQPPTHTSSGPWGRTT